MDIVERYLTVMAAVLHADRIVHEAEETLFLRMLRDAGIRGEFEEKCRALLDETNRDVEIASLRAALDAVDTETLVWIIRDAFLMADADGGVSDDELSVIDECLRLAGIEEGRLEAVHAWGNETLAHLKRGYLLLSERVDQTELRRTGG